MNRYQIFGGILGLLGFTFFNFFNFFPENIPASNLVAILFLVVSFWIFEVLPLSVTALFPFLLFPVYGIIKADTVASYYLNSTIFLFLGGFLLAYSMETWNLHKRISLVIIKKIGHTPGSLILGFMIASAFLSMFISNTATAIMMLPIGLSVIKKIETSFDSSNSRKFTVSILLGIAYSASIGGIATLIGTAPNLSFKRIFEQSFPNLPEVTFTQWMAFALPVSIIMLILTWLLLTKILYKTDSTLKIDKNIIKKEIEDLPKISYQEKMVLIITNLAALLWIFRVDIEIGSFTIYGWSNLFEYSKFIDDGSVAIFISILLFSIPSKSLFTKLKSTKNNHNIKKDGNANSDVDLKNNLENNLEKNSEDKLQHKFLLPTESLNHIPWDVLLLLGGGFALAQGFQTTGFSEIVGKSLSNINNFNNITIVLFICLILTFLTELTSNTATTNTILPILVSISVATGIDPLLLMVPATISASFAFMLPVATPPNSIVFSSGAVKIKDMIISGFILNIIGVIVVTLLIVTWGRVVFNF